VHKNKDGKALVLAVFLHATGNSPDSGSDNEYLNQFWQKIPTNLVDTRKNTIKHPYRHFLPADKSYYYYNGSFTTPPCTTDTKWVVLRTPVQLSVAQREAFRKQVGEQEGSQLVVSPFAPRGVTEPWDVTLGVDDRPVQLLGSRKVFFGRNNNWGSDAVMV